MRSWPYRSRAAERLLAALDIPLYRFLGGVTGNRLPVPMMNIVNGGCHALSSGLDVQEFMIMPVGAPSFKEGLRWCCRGLPCAGIDSEIHEDLQPLLATRAVLLRHWQSDEEAIETILEAVQKAGYEPGKDFMIAMDAASSEWKSRQGRRVQAAEGRYEVYTSDELIAHWKTLVEKYPDLSPSRMALDEEDWEGWKKLTARAW